MYKFRRKKEKKALIIIIKIIIDYDGDCDTSYNRRTWTPNAFKVNWKSRKLEDESRPSKLQIGQNTEKSSGDLRRLAVTQSPVTDSQLMLV